MTTEDLHPGEPRPPVASPRAPEPERAPSPPAATPGPSPAAGPLRSLRHTVAQLGRRFAEVRAPLGPLPSAAELGEVARRAMGGFPGRWSPPVDVFVREGALVVRADLPGVSAADLRVELVGHSLVLEGERRAERQAPAGRGHAERGHGQFRRVVDLPAGREVEQVSATLSAGVLEVSLLLRPVRQRVQRIDVRTEGPDAGGTPPVH